MNPFPFSRLAALAGLLWLSCASAGALSAQTVQSETCSQRLDVPLRAVHLSGNWGTTNEYFVIWEANRNQSLIPLEFVEYLQGLHVNWVGLVVTLHFDDSMDSTVERVYTEDRNIQTFSDEALRQAIREFRQHGFNVYLTLALDDNKASRAERPATRWQLGDPGVPADNIEPEFWPWRPDHPDHTRFVREFWSTYTDEAVHFARIAQQEGVGIYSLGTETDRLFRSRSGDWGNNFSNELRAMVDRVRAAYDGLLTYDMHYSVLSEDGSKYLWQDLDLDLVGISAWFPLAESSPSTVMGLDALKQAYERIFQNRLIPLAARNPGRPIVFLEYAAPDTVEAPANPDNVPGYPLFVFSDRNGNGIDDGRETQANIFQALFETMDLYPGVVNGAFFWDNWITDNEHWEEFWGKRRNFDFRNKPAEKIVGAHYERYQREEEACTRAGLGDPAALTAQALAEQRLILTVPRGETVEEIALAFLPGNRFEETRSGGGDTTSRSGTYGYRRIGLRQGWLALDYEDGESCVVAIDFISATTGTAHYGCSSASSGQGRFRLTTTALWVPVVLSSAGRSDSFFSSELTLTNRGPEAAILRYTYTAHSGGGSGTATDRLAPGRQRIEPDAIGYLAGLGIPIPDRGNRIGTLRVAFSGSSEVGVVVRTTTAVSDGRAGLAYPGIGGNEGFRGAVYLCGLRQNEEDRSNVAFQNMGDEGEITLRTTVFSGNPADPRPRLLEDVTLPPGGFHQYSGVLGVLANEGGNRQGYVKVERIEGTAPFYAYGVINDQVNSDGSFVFPVPAGALVGATGQTLPVIVETGVFTSELMVTNFSDAAKTVRFRLRSDAVQTPDKTAAFEWNFQPGQQVIVPNVVGTMRQVGPPGVVPSGRAIAGAVFATVAEGDMSGIAIGARTAAPGGGGQYGVFYDAIPYGRSFLDSAWVEALQQNVENRSNLALVNTGEIDDSPSVFQLDIYDGETGEVANTITGLMVPAGGWHQINGILGSYAPGTTQGYVRIRRISGNNPFLAYGIINDGGVPGQRSGDGAYLPARE